MLLTLKVDCQVTLTVFLPPSLAQQLKLKLHALFAIVDEVAAVFCNFVSLFLANSSIFLALSVAYFACSSALFFTASSLSCLFCSRSNFFLLFFLFFSSCSIKRTTHFELVSIQAPDTLCTDLVFGVVATYCTKYLEIYLSSS